MLFKFTLYILLSFSEYLLSGCWFHYSFASLTVVALIHYLVKLTNAVVSPGKQADVVVKENEEGIDLKKKSTKGRDWGYRR